MFNIFKRPKRSGFRTATAQFRKLFHEEVGSIREFAKGMAEVREPDTATVDALMEESASFNLCLFHREAQSKENFDAAVWELFNNAWISLLTGPFEEAGFRVNPS